MSNWVQACSTEDIDEEDLIRWDHGGRTYAIYNTEKGFFATDGYCTHEEQHLEDGLVIDCVIECPLHGGRFDICTGKALSAPCTQDLKTYPVKIEGGQVFVQLG
ncbi:non-heme iron oxygenase ferredoxin subunit [Ruegeria marisrubri]|uniref:non-heme iron oxygenase ferredoxin subunit n=1 Tax=Ruegeria marisrubri TaxID=1685379 RepID=UPI001CD48AD2|nr:non-heme iron oxygenase ferredoxin subunit [Ruegeria marisrubri]MCA0906990.1 non-heme iron oxygenase ferredoxin subunit [Ruegeria marisrubri]